MAANVNTRHRQGSWLAIYYSRWYAVVVNQASQEAARPPKPMDSARAVTTMTGARLAGEGLPRLKAPHAQDETPRQLVCRSVGHHRGDAARPFCRHSVADSAPSPPLVSAFPNTVA